MSVRMTSVKWAVWYHSVGCLPDSEHPEFVADSIGEAYDWIAENQHEYRRETEHDLYVLSVDTHEVEFADD